MDTSPDVNSHSSQATAPFPRPIWLGSGLVADNNLPETPLNFATVCKERPRQFITIAFKGRGVMVAATTR